MSADTSQLDAYAKRLQTAPARIGKAVAGVARKSGRRVSDRTERNAPRGKTGDLKESVHEPKVEGSGSSRGVFVRVETSAKYARHVNYGTTRMAPNPFATNAVQAESAAFLAAVEAAVRRELT